MSLVITHVNVKVKPGTAEAFVEATRKNARGSRKEPGVVRFDILASTEDPNRFLLVEIYRSVEAVAAHKETEHYKTWRDVVSSMMAEPRSSAKFTNLDPADHGWA